MDDGSQRWLSRRTTSCVLLALGIAALAPACEDRVERPTNVLLVSIDTLRADRVGCYGRENAGTPTLDALAARGTRFANAMAPSPMTLPSHATLFTGHAGLRHRVRHNGLFSLPGETVTVTERFAEAGFRTGAFVGSVVLASQYGLAQGFEAYTAPSHSAAPGMFYVSERPASEVNLDALTWLDGIGEDRFFLFVHYMEPHAPYAPPEPERSRFPHDRYQGEVAAADRFLGELLDGLSERGRLDDTLVVVIADHGESLGEHGELTHGLLLYQATLHVPVIVAGPGVHRGRVVEEPVGLVDVAPTLVGAFGLRPGSVTDGRDVWPALTQGTVLRERALYAETFVPWYDYGWSELRALRRGPLKYIQAPRPELYRLDLDPHESGDRAGVDLERTEAMAGAMAERIAAVEGRGQRPGTVRLSPEDRQALEALGYLKGPGAAGAGADRPDPKDRIAAVTALDRADRLADLGEYGEAERLLREAIAENPTFLDTRLRLVVVLIRSGKVDEAIAAGRALDEQARQIPLGERIAAQAHLLLAQMYLDHGRLEEAVGGLERALAAPQSSKVHDLLAAVYHDLGRDEEAIRVLRDLEARGRASERSLRMLRLLESRTAGNP